MLQTVNGVQLAFSDTLDGEHTVLLVHGYPLDRAMWDPQIGAIRSQGWRAIAPDLRGFGASEAGTPGALTMDQHADDLAALLDARGVTQPVVFVGLSMGGYVGFAFWRRHRRRVRAFVLADTRAQADPPELKQTRAEIAESAERLNSSQPAIDSMRPRLFSPHLHKGSLAEHVTLGIMQRASARCVADGARGLAQRPDSFPTLPTIDVPTLVIVGEHDVLTPPDDARAIAQAVSGSELVTIEQAGHMSNLENPEAFNTALIAFLKTL